ncbi:MAG: hypothetical protein SF066_04420 [Thermoanaerobaculia bacterium]|nr:hypothetical protein [Thermoanaerobaculia bacterium]
MLVTAEVKDALQVNWTLPAAWLPPAPEPLRYELHPTREGDRVLASALLFHVETVRLGGMPAPHPSFPQFQLRLAALDGDRMPAVYFRRFLVPAWALPAAWLIGRQPAGAARLDFPRPSESPEGGPWRWAVAGRRGLVVTARRGGGPVAEPSFGSFAATVGYFLERSRGYVGAVGGLRRLEVEQPLPLATPVTVEVQRAGLLEEALGLPRGAVPTLHSAWLCADWRVSFEVLPELEPNLARVPAPG